MWRKFNWPEGAFIRATLGCGMILIALQGHAPAQNPAPKAARIDEVVTLANKYRMFNGAVLVAENGKVIYKKGVGLANMEWNIPNLPDTRFRLGSITKQFTAALILQLVEQDKVKLDGKVSDYLPKYRKDIGEKVTVHQLLNHTSGIPSYTGLPGFSNDVSRNPYTVDEFVAKYASNDLEFEPGSRFSYNNSGYFLLGAIIEKVTGQPFEKVLKEKILDPLGMKNTGYDHYGTIIKQRAAGYQKTPDGYINAEYLDMSIPYAAGSLYSTVEDLYLWDQALYTDRLLSPQSKALMYKPHLDNYAYGWTITKTRFGAGVENVPIITHGGGINGFSTVIARFPLQKHLIVLLDNTAQGRGVEEIEQEVTRILYGQPHDLPRMPLAEMLLRTIGEKGIEAALTQYRDLKAKQAKVYDFREPELNRLGYQLLQQNKLKEAIEIFKLNVAQYPGGFNTYDSLGEAYMMADNTELAIQNYKKSIELNPENTHGAEMLKRLEKKPGVAAPNAYDVNAQTSQLGKVEFPTSGSERAQTHFLRGLAALHSFWYEEALEAFRESTKAEPDFTMGYWGEAMAHNHPLWSEQDTAAAREVIAKIKPNPKLTRREAAYLEAVKLLYGEGEKTTRDAAYAAAMEKIYGNYPEDLDAAAFYSLSLLGMVRFEEKSYRLQARAGAIALDVYQKNPNHPGAAHYIIHAFDDPEHAILALPAARRYAEIAPEAPHARHMPSHIFLQLGMWPEAAASNESAWEASESWMKRKNLSTSVRDYHSLHWLLYVYLQQGRFRKAEELLAVMKKTMTDSTYDNKLRPGYYENNFASMAAAFVVETERWDLAETLFPVSRAGSLTAQVSASGHGGHGGGTAVATDGPATVRTSNRGQRLPLFVRGLANARKSGLAGEAASFETAKNSGGTQQTIAELEVAALAASTRKDYQRASELMKQAITLEEQMGPPSGPPSLIKPAHELYGEILLQAGKPHEAAEQFDIALMRQPNRARSLLGAARAAAQSGNHHDAALMYTRLLEQWRDGDADLPELREAREAVQKTQK